MSFITYFQLFASFWCSALLTLFPGIITYRQFALIMAFVSVLAITVQIIHAKGKIARPTARVFVIFAILCLLYSLTPFLYRAESTQAYHGFWLALLGQVFPAALMATFIAVDETAIFQLKRYAIFVAVIFTALSIVAVFNPSLATTGGFADNENGLNYQSASYLAGYASGLFCFVYITRDWEGHLEFVKKSIGLVGIFVGIVLNFITILISGGRGGLACFIGFILLTLLIKLNDHKDSLNAVIRNFVLVAVLLIGGYFAIRYAASSSIATSGYSRIITLFSNRDNNGRTAIANEAVKYIYSSPVVGHGLGSVFYELGYYAHNIFLDILIETGIFGLILFLFILIRTLKKMIKFVKLDKSDCFFVFVFLCEFIESLFSGYYLSLVSMIWSICFVFARSYYLNNRAD